MEGVEDIPGSALAEGIKWGAWETFPEYMGAADAFPIFVLCVHFVVMVDRCCLQTCLAAKAGSWTSAARSRMVHCGST
eukprot:SAG11_NODE_5040_length_1682_cov_2.234997_3_plen_78_part_00